jgi:multicomponent Na+:H+ antiporter subunit F
MNEFLLGAAVFVLVMVALGLVRVKLGPGYADRMMAAQLLGSGSIAVLLLVSTAIGVDAVVDVALTLALLAAFASLAFVHYAVTKQRQGSEQGSAQGDGQDDGA